MDSFEEAGEDEQPPVLDLGSEVAAEKKSELVEEECFDYWANAADVPNATDEDKVQTMKFGDAKLTGIFRKAVDAMPPPDARRLVRRAVAGISHKTLLDTSDNQLYDGQLRDTFSAATASFGKREDGEGAADEEDVDFFNLGMPKISTEVKDPKPAKEDSEDDEVEGTQPRGIGRAGPSAAPPAPSPAKRKQQPKGSASQAPAKKAKAAAPAASEGSVAASGSSDKDTHTARSAQPHPAKK